jgi:hypothetical protein
MILTRSDLEMMLDEMDKNNADNIKIYVGYNYDDYEIEYIDFDMYGVTQHHRPNFIKTVLTLEP